MSDIASPPQPRPLLTFGPGAETLLFWEKGRVMYNAILLLIAVPFVGFSFWYWPAFIGLAIAANALYCVAYPVDLLMQQTVFAAGWMRVGRWLLLIGGTALAAILAISVTYGAMTFDAMNLVMD
ncbi:MAG: hypothetical protein IT535_00405 [Bauldia sp.]|nr:hypothetical protein [Bauldia sp.]